MEIAAAHVRYFLIVIRILRFLPIIQQDKRLSACQLTTDEQAYQRRSRSGYRNDFVVDQFQRKLSEVKRHLREQPHTIEAHLYCIPGTAGFAVISG